MTSVKNFRVTREATADSLGRGVFEFTDAYSVFDWGKMPDDIPEKGASLCTMGAFNFEMLAEAGVPTHYRGVIVNGEVRSLEEALDEGHVPREMAIELTQVPELPFENGAYDYDAYHERASENFLVPLEIVFRNRVPVGSSLRKRSEPEDHGLDVPEWPDVPVDLPDAIVEFSSKYVEQDRYLSREEADAIAGAASVDDLESIARDVNRIITEQAERTGLAHEDGKIECLYYDGEVRVADVVGTFDENRFSYGGQQLSKEVIRQYHKRTQPEWVEAVSEAKATANEQNIDDWRALCDREPQPLEDDVVQASRDMYCAGTNAYMQAEVFGAPSLEEALATITEL